MYRILLIDDQETIHQDYRKILGSYDPAAAALDKAAVAVFGDDPALLFDWEGFELDSAYQGQEGLELVQRSIEEGRRYAVAFVDIRMPPGWDGIQTVRRIWEVDPEILVVICSAYTDYSWEEMVRQLGRNDRFLILKKPFDNIEVRQCAMALTERWSVSRTDVLTSLLNRRAFHGHCELEWSRASRHDLPLACAMVDLDFFKRVNDTLGHQAGDFVLKAIAERLQSKCRASDFVCRYGGEELCALLPHTNEEGAAAWAEHARHMIESQPVMVGDRAIQVTASFGVADRLGSADCIEQLIDRADQALLVAKKLGRNRVVCYSAVGEIDGTPLDQAGNRNRIFQGVTAKDVMTAPVACLPVEGNAGESAEFFLQYRINSAPVIDANGKLIGILSEKDVLGILLNDDAWSTPIERIMQRNVVCYDEDASVQSICEFLSRVAVRRVVIVHDGCPTGVVSRGSLLRWYSNAIAAHRTTSEPRPEAACNDEGRDRLIQGVHAVAQCAVELSQTVTSYADDLVPPVIVGVSKLQELINDLLTSSQSGNSSAANHDESGMKALSMFDSAAAVLS